MKYKTIQEFDKDFKILSKRFRTLVEDFEIFKKFTIETYYNNDIETSAFVSIKGFCNKQYISNKVRKFACKSLKGKGAASGIRIIFVWDKEEKTITFIEIYFKADKENEDQHRLICYLKQKYKEI